MENIILHCLFSSSGLYLANIPHNFVKIKPAKLSIILTVNSQDSPVSLLNAPLAL